MFIPTKIGCNGNTKHMHFFYVEVMLLPEHDKIKVELHTAGQWIQR